MVLKTPTARTPWVRRVNSVEVSSSTILTMKLIAIIFLITLCGSTHALKCYVCESLTDKCSDTDIGVETECPSGTKGCVIAEITESESELFARNCIPTEEQFEITCREVDTDKGKERACACSGDLCNKNWTTAGGSGTILTLPLLLTLVVFYLSE